jgi:DNA end-binding protein Ku
MTRALWEGRLALGLVSVPVRLYPTAEPKDVRFRTLHASCLTPLQYERYCPRHKIDVLWEEAVRGFEHARGKYIPVTEEELARAHPRASKTLGVVAVLDEGVVDPLRFDRQFYLVPAGEGLAAYRVLAEAMRRSRKNLLGRLVLRHKQHLALVRPSGDALVAATLYYDDELRRAGDFAELRNARRPSSAALEMARELLRSLSAPFEPSRYRDEYRRHLREFLEAKVKGTPLLLPPAHEPGPPPRLLDALRASVNLAKRSRRRPAKA